MRYFYTLFGLLLFLMTASASSGVTIDWVPVGNPMNAPDTRVMDDGTTGYGAVSYAYQISKHEVTNGQYAEFLNSVAGMDTFGLYSPQMGILGGIARSGSSGSFVYNAVAGRENKPVNYVSSYDALRFANWLSNGQPTGSQNDLSTEDGSYTLGGAFVAGARNADARIVLPTENEWYKAAYYAPNVNAYYLYPFADGVEGGSITSHCEAPPGTTSHSANCFGRGNGLTNVGAYANSPSAYGTFDQAGNVSEWNEAVILGALGETLNGIRGGTGFSVDIISDDRGATFPDGEFGSLGFRLAMIPEPSTGLLMITGLLWFAIRRENRT
jgi:formylglycine-generating enzyme